MKTSFRTTIKDRAYLTPLVISGILLLILLIMGLIHIRYSELQVIVRYTSFGITKLYKEQWYYQLNFMLFGLIVYAMHTLIGLRLYQKKGQEFAIAFQWFTVAVLAITVAIVGAIFRVSSIG